MRKIILTIESILLAVVSVYSQSVTETRCIKTTAIDICEKYMDVMANLYNGDVYNEDKFLILFDEKASIYNDILPINKPQELTPKEYFDKFTNNIKINYVEYENFNFKFPTQNQNDKWEIECSFRKNIRLKSQLDIYFPKWSFNYTITIVMDKQYNQIYKVYNNAKIKSIEVETPLEDFFIIVNNEDLQIILASTKDIIQDWDNDYKSRIFSKSDYLISDFDIAINNDKSNYFYKLEKKWTQNNFDEYSYYPEFKYKKINYYGFGLNYSPISFGNKISNINIEKFNEIKQVNNYMSFSYIYGYQFAHNKKSTWFFSIDLEADLYNYSYSGTNYTEYNSIDVDGDSYLRKIRINSLNEKINIFSVSIPLSLEYLIQLSKNPYFLSFKLGGFAGYSLYSKSDYNLNVDYHGLYNYYGGVEFDHYYDYGNFDVSGKQELFNIGNIGNDYKMNNLHYDYGAIVGAGLWFPIKKSYLLRLDVSYKYSFNTPLKYKENYIISENSNSFQSLLQSTKQGLKNIYIGVSLLHMINVE